MILLSRILSSSIGGIEIQLRVLHSWVTLQGGSLVSSSDIYRLLLGEEEDDATSPLAAPKPEPDAQKVSVTGFQEVCILLSNFILCICWTLLIGIILCKSDLL